MIARLHSTFALRPYLPADAPRLADIFRASIEQLTGDDYTDAQRKAWASSAGDEDAFASKLAEELTLVATRGGSPVAFASLKGNERIDSLYVHPAASGQGVGAMLADALEKLAAARGAKQLNVEASDNAADFFQRRGYVPQQRNSILRAGEWLANTTMTKQLAAQGERS